LYFSGPFSTVVTSELKLTNPSGKKAAFKVKTTAPKRYCVRPNSGLLEPNGQVVVSGARMALCSIVTSVSETIRKLPLVKAQTAVRKQR